jgi:uncharacterized protein YukE
MSGPADIIDVQFAALRQAASTLGVRASALTNHIEQLVQSLKPLKDTWVASGSSAGQAAEQSETRLRAAIADLIQVINQFSGKVNEAHDTQVALENQNAGFFG